MSDFDEVKALLYYQLAHWDKMPINTVHKTHKVIWFSDHKSGNSSLIFEEFLWHLLFADKNFLQYSNRMFFFADEYQTSLLHKSDDRTCKELKRELWLCLTKKLKQFSIGYSRAFEMCDSSQNWNLLTGWEIFSNLLSISELFHCTNVIKTKPKVKISEIVYTLFLCNPRKSFNSFLLHCTDIR